MMEAKRIIDIYALKKIRELTADPDNKENLRQATEYINRIPSLEAVSITRVEPQYGTSENNEGDEEKVEYLIDIETILQEYADTGLLCDLTDEQLQRFGYESKEMFKKNSQKIRLNLTMGINFYDLLRPMNSSLEKGMFDAAVSESKALCEKKEKQNQELLLAAIAKSRRNYEEIMEFLREDPEESE